MFIDVHGYKNTDIVGATSRSRLDMNILIYLIFIVYCLQLVCK